MRALALAVVALALGAAPAAAVLPAGNVIVNPGAELDTEATITNTPDVDVEGFEPEVGRFTAIRYSGPTYPTAVVGTAIRGGAIFFAGGSGGRSSATQDVDLRAAAPEFDRGDVPFSLSALVGGILGQGDSAIVRATFLDGAGAPLGEAVVGPVTARERKSKTTLLPRARSGRVPSGTRSVRISLEMVRTSGSSNDGYVDNLSLTFGTDPPVVGVSVVAEPIEGTVLVRPKGSKRFVALRRERSFPTGSEFDTRGGVMALDVAADRTGTVDVAEIAEGRFVATQNRATDPVTRLRLTEPLTGCPSARARGAAKKKRKPKSRRLRVKETAGDFTTKGQYAAASVEGTEWLTIDTCLSTTVRVIEGTVSVRDLVRNRTQSVPEGESYTARRR